MVQAWSIGKASRYQDGDRQRGLSTGPGQYEQPLVNKKSEPKWTMASKGVRDLNKSVVPGPQAYNIPSRVVEHPGISMGTRNGSSLNQTIDVPGPGQYTPSKGQKTFAFTMGQKFQSMDMKFKQGIPGPGQYEQNPKQFTPSVKFGTSLRQSLESGKEMVPGPGNYSANFDNFNKTSPKFRFGTSSRQESSEKLQGKSPGPGSYALEGVIGKDGPSQTMVGRGGESPERKETLSKPGPGQYDATSLILKKRQPSFKLGSSKRQDLSAKKNEFKPSPNIYNPVDTFTKTNSAAWGFGSGKRDTLSKSPSAESPSPNQYTVPSRFQEGPKYAMGMKTVDLSASKRNCSPGPGQYTDLSNQNSRIKAEPKFSIGSSKRPDLTNAKDSTNMPGPGNYSILDDSFTKKIGPKYGFGTSKRDESPNGSKNNGLGPGAYELKQSEGKGISISPKLEGGLVDKESRNKPGPGTYDNSMKDRTLKKMPAYKIGSEKRSDNVAKTRQASPDPGVYDPKIDFTKTNASSFVFGTGKRQQIGANQAEKVPGPGEYNQPSKAFDKPKFHMGIKYNDHSKQLTPGPADYEQRTSVLKKQLPSYSMCGRYGQKEKHQAPGPGQYTVAKEILTGPKYGFGSSKRASPKRDDVPGPGQYKLPTKVASVEKYSLPNQNEEFRFV